MSPNPGECTLKKIISFIFFYPSLMKPLLPPPPPPASSPLLSLPSLTPYPPPWECRGLLRLGHSLLSPLSVSLPVSLSSSCLALCRDGRAGQKKKKKKACVWRPRQETNTHKKTRKNASKCCKKRTHTRREKLFFFLNSVLQMDSRLVRLLSNESDEYTQMWNVNN